MRRNKIPDFLLKEEIGKSGYTAYFVASCKKQGEQFYSRTDLLIFWHKTSVNVAWRENTVIVNILLQKYNVCGFIHAYAKHIIISEVLRIGICPYDAFTLDYCMHQSAGYSWSCLYTILKWQLIISSVRREIWSFWMFCCKNTTYVVLFMHSTCTYIISEFTHHRLVVAMGRGGKEVWSFKK